MTGRRHRLAQRRKAVGLSQERLAEVIRVERSTVVRWERGDTNPQPWHRPRIATALKISIDKLAELLDDTSETPARPSERLDYVLQNPRNVDLIAIAHLREQIRRLDEQYERVPSTVLLAQMGQLHGQIVFLGKHARPGAVRRELCAAHVESATLMGQLIWDASQRRDHTAATDYFDQAIATARKIRDLAAEAHAELRKSYVALYGTHDPTAGLALAHRAALAGEHDSHVIAGLAMLHAGEAHAMLGDTRSCEHALGAAEAHFARITPDDPARLLYCPSQHGRLTGSCWLFLGNPRKAEPILDHTRRLLDERKKSTAIVLANLGLASIRQRSIEAATGYLHQAMDTVEQTRSGGGFNVLCSAVRELRPWRNEPAVQDVNDRLLTLLTAG